MAQIVVKLLPPKEKLTCMRVRAGDDQTRQSSCGTSYQVNYLIELNEGTDCHNSFTR